MVLTGAGEAFTAGMDLKEFFRETDSLSRVERDIKQRSCFEWQGPRLRPFPLTTIAMVNGYWFGGGFLPLSSCDLAVAADDALFGLSEVNWGIVPGGNVPHAVIQTMNLRDAMYYSITGEPFDGRKAAEMGLVNESVARDRLPARVLEIAELMKTENPAIVRGTKETIRPLRTMGWSEGENYINAKFAEALYSDHEQGRARGVRPGRAGRRTACVGRWSSVPTSRSVRGARPRRNPGAGDRVMTPTIACSASSPSPTSSRPGSAGSTVSWRTCPGSSWTGWRPREAPATSPRTSPSGIRCAW